MTIDDKGEGQNENHQPRLLVNDEKLKEITKWKTCYQHLKKLNILYILGVLRLHENEAPSNEQAEILVDIQEILEEEKDA
jgi:hypothetical protein